MTTLIDPPNDAAAMSVALERLYRSVDAIRDAVDVISRIASRPAGCVCSVNDWDERTIPSPCGRFVDDDTGICENCEHPAECHGGGE